ncbi:hypothetical protein KAU11_00005 [Candidatus Babeliales bacterium]|nr:hypothetical protein [Candidatus Babeliales bacterium]
MKTKNQILLIALVAFCLTNSSLRADEEQNTPPEVLFAKAQALSSKGKYKNAIKEYQKSESKGHDVLLNMGSCAYNMGKLGKALLYWRRAERGWNWGDRQELLTNIKQVQTRAGTILKSGILGTWSTAKAWTFSLLVSAPMLILQILFLMAWIALAFYLKTKSRETQEKTAKPLFILTLLLGAIVFGRFFVNAQRSAVVTAKEATLHSGPGRDYPVLGKTCEATEGIIKITSDGFYKVKIGKRVGWISNSEIEKV